MSKLEILIVENEEASRLTIESVLFGLGYTNMHIAENAEEAVKVIQERTIDLVLMDIQLNGHITGIDLANIIKNEKNAPPVVFITGYNDKETYEKAKATKPAAYLVKPFNEFTLEAAIETAINNFYTETERTTTETEVLLEDCVFIKNGRVLSKVSYKDILWIQSDGNYSIVQGLDKKYALKSSLSSVDQSIPSDIFIRVHKRYIVQLSLIDKVNIQHKELHIGTQIIPFGRAYKEELLSRLKRL